jgi:hypothetical protein
MCGYPGLAVRLRGYPQFLQPDRLTYSHPESNSSSYKAATAQHLGAQACVGAGAFDHIRRFVGGGSGLRDDSPRVGGLGPRQASS